MQSDTEATERHYTHGDLLQRVSTALEKLGKSPSTVSVDDLGPVDEFHVGGRIATEHLLQQLDIQPEAEVLDVGCGIGGTARLVASKYDGRVKGIDLTQEYVDAGNTLNAWVGLSEKISLTRVSATQMSFPERTFDVAVMLHVGMNIDDKRALFREIFRVLKSGAQFGLYDIMSLGNGNLTFPVPWATDAEVSHVESSETYEHELDSAGFRIDSIENRGEFAKEFLTSMKNRMKSGDRPPPLGLHVIMGSSAPMKIKNLAAGIFEGTISPVQIIATKPLEQ